MKQIFNNYKKVIFLTKKNVSSYKIYDIKVKNIKIFNIKILKNFF